MNRLQNETQTDGAIDHRTDTIRNAGNDMITERIHQCLDGTLPRSALTDAEREELERLEALVDGSLAFARETETPDVRASVMDRIARVDAVEPAPARAPEGIAARVAAALRWIWTPRTVRVRPAWAVAGVAALALTLATLPLGTGTLGPGPVASDSTGGELAAGVGQPATPVSDAREPRLYVRFELDASDASSVRLAGSFTSWEPEYELAETRPGQWSTLVPLRPGVHDYAFVVDGERWVADPDAIQVDDGFGGVNSRIALLTPQEVRDARS